MQQVDLVTMSLHHECEKLENELSLTMMILDNPESDSELSALLSAEAFEKFNSSGLVKSVKKTLKKLKDFIFSIIARIFNKIRAFFLKRKIKGAIASGWLNLSDLSSDDMYPSVLAGAFKVNRVGHSELIVQLMTNGDYFNDLKRSASLAGSAFDILNTFLYEVTDITTETRGFLKDKVTDDDISKLEARLSLAMETISRPIQGFDDLFSTLGVRPVDEGERVGFTSGSLALPRNRYFSEVLGKLNDLDEKKSKFKEKNAKRADSKRIIGDTTLEAISTISNIDNMLDKSVSANAKLSDILSRLLGTFEREDLDKTLSNRVNALIGRMLNAVKHTARWTSLYVQIFERTSTPLSCLVIAEEECVKFKE